MTLEITRITAKIDRETFFRGLNYDGGVKRGLHDFGCGYTAGWEERVTIVPTS